MMSTQSPENIFVPSFIVEATYWSFKNVFGVREIFREPCVVAR
jgi:hypothetical protein